MNLRQWMFGLTTALLLSTAACGSGMKVTVKSTPLSPSAECIANANFDREHLQTSLELKLKHLPLPNDILPEGRFFVVWWKAANAKDIWHRLGALTFDKGDRAGEFKATVGEVEFTLLITVETDLNPGTASAKILFEQAVAGK